MSTAAPESQATIEQKSPTSRTTDGNLSALRRALVLGTGLGIAIGEKNLEIAIVRSRPAGPTQFASTSIADFRNRPAAQWGAELSQFVAQAGGAGLAATVLLPRSEVIVRTLSLPGVADKEVANAIGLQVDTLHPWGDVEVAWGWARAGNADVIVGLARKEMLEAYETLFSEAGIGMAAVTFSSAVIHSAIRIWSGATAAVLCFRSDADGRTEVYGESDSRAVFSAEFSVPRERALALARAELRLPPDYPATSLPEVLPQAAGTAPVEDKTVLAYAAALAGSAPRVARFPNLLPSERRASHDRMQYLVPGILGSLLVLALVTVFAIFPAIEQRRYLNELSDAARQLEPTALRAQALDKKTVVTRLRIAQLDELRRRPQADLDVLNELTKLLAPPIWTSSVEIYPDSVVIAGEADQASSLLKVLDGSPLFQNSEFTLGVTRNGQTEQFRIKTLRRGRAGKDDAVTISERDRRALILLGAGLAAAAILYVVFPNGSGATSVAAPAVNADSVGLAQQRLVRLRQIAATLPGREAAFKQAAADLSDRERGTIQADTAPQAQAALLEIARRIGKNEDIVVLGGDFGAPKAFGDYGLVYTTVTFECHVEQLVNFLADLSKQPEILVPSEERITLGNPKEKTMGVRMVLAGLVAKKLVPEKKGLGGF